MKKIVAVLLLASATQACSGGPPSKSEVEKAVKLTYSDCPRLAVENFKLVNGMKIDDLNHQVEVQFNLKFIPLPASRVKEIDAIAGDHEAKLQARWAHHRELEQKAKESVAEADRLTNEINAQLAAEGVRWGTDEYDARYKPLAEQKGIPQMYKQAKEWNAEIRGQGQNQEPVRVAPPVSLEVEWGTTECRMKSGVKWMDDKKSMKEAVRNGAVNPVHATFNMRKTDNGWMRVR